MDPDKNSIMTLTPITQAKPEDITQRNQYLSGIIIVSCETHFHTV